MIAAILPADRRGALAVVDQHSNILELADLPMCVASRIRWVDGDAIATLLAKHRSGRPLQIVIEQPRRVVHTNNGVFEAGVLFGSLVRTCHALGHVHMVGTAWRKQVGLTGNDPAAALAAVNLLHPGIGLTEVRHVDKAVALLLAEHASRFMRRPNP